MQAKLRVYLLLIASSGLIFLVLYKTLTGVEEEPEIRNGRFAFANDAKTARKLFIPRVKPLENINDLMPVTQSQQHLERQRLREAEVHAKIRQNSVHKSKEIGQDDTGIDKLATSLKNPEQIEEIHFDHPGMSLNQMVSKGMPKANSETLTSTVEFTIQKKLVHLDLKGAPPLVSYYKKLFPLLNLLGATGLLIEYEDMFPYNGPLESLPAHNAYSPSNITEILQLALRNNLEVIPLIQTFGHMEFVLKQEKYQDLREVPTYPQVICPTNNASQNLIKKMIDQVVSLHPNIHYLHIGSDEVYYIGECDRCKNKMHKLFMDKEELFIDHVKGIAKYVKEKYNIQPIMWDDMFRMVPDEIIEKSSIWKYVDIMAWQYGPIVELKIPPDAWDKYNKYFSGIWLASAFKGATGPDQFITDISYHLENHISWMDVMNKYHNKIPFKGFVITGWQRYDHFAVLCELLPVSIPSLAVNLLFLEEGIMNSYVVQKTKDLLQCDEHFAIAVNYSVEEVMCNYPGSKIFKGAQRLARLKLQLQKLMRNNHLVGWMNEYNVLTSFSSPAHVELGTHDLEALQTNATLLYTYMQNIMTEVYDKYTINEWLQTFLDPIMKKIQKIKISANNLLKYSTWPRRPFILNS